MEIDVLVGPAHLVSCPSIISINKLKRQMGMLHNRAQYLCHNHGELRILCGTYVSVNHPTSWPMCFLGQPVF